MSVLHNVKVTRSSVMKEGTNEYGPWQLWKFFINDTDWSKEAFTVFRSGDQPLPTIGTSLLTIEYEAQARESGGKTYTNYFVSKMDVKISPTNAEEPKPLPSQKSEFEPPTTDSKTQVTPKTDSKPLPVPSRSNIHDFSAMYVSYAKDLTVALINGGLVVGSEGFSISKLKDLLRKTVLAIAENGKILELAVEDPAALKEMTARISNTQKLKDLCKKNEISYQDAKTFLSESQTFGKLILKSYGNLSFESTPSKITNEIIETSEQWIGAIKRQSLTGPNPENPIPENPENPPLNLPMEAQSVPLPDTLAGDDIPF